MKATNKEEPQLKKVRVRYAPSPTGIPHVGNIRTALFNYLFAKNKGGDFVLRIEDTDQARKVPEAEEKIKESLKLLGLNWDEEFVQSTRLEIYSKYLEELKSKGLVYKDEGAYRFKVQPGKSYKWKDAVHGDVEFKSDVVEDFVIIKSDGYPTYHFASVVDDHEMKISHVFRGDEWISSTPKHLMLYEAFEWESPIFVHLPAILGVDKKKLSKRMGAKSTIEFLEDGYLPEALVNFLALLGWAPKSNQEIFSLEELTQEFSLERINKNSPIFNLEKLDWFNSQWIRRIDESKLVDLIVSKNKNYKSSVVKDILPIVKARLSSINDFSSLAHFLIEDNIKIDPEKIILSSEKLGLFKEIYENIKNWNKENITNATNSAIDNSQVSKPEALSSIGASVSGSTVTPPIYDSLEYLGKEKTIKRLDEAIRSKK